jgi:predicted nucleotidyltransferase
MKTTYKISSIAKKIYPILKRYQIIKASVFGSLARGQDSGNSDIDLLVEFTGNKSLMDLAGLKIDLEERLKKTVDVLTYKSLHPLLKYKILSEHKLIYEKRH